MEYLGMSAAMIEAAERSATPDRQSVGSGSCKQTSRPNSKGYTKMPNLHENSPHSRVVSERWIDGAS